MSDEPKGMHEFRRQMQQGVSATFLAEVFHVSPHVVRRKINALKPVGERGGDPIYDLAEAAQYLVKPRVDLAEYIKNLRPQDAPVALQKQFWDSQNGRLKYMQEAGELWHTFRVQTAVVDILKVVRQQVRLFSDTVERKTELTEKQRALILGMSDGLLNDMYKAIAEHFGNYDAEGERDEVFEKGPPVPPPVGEDDFDAGEPGGDNDEFDGL